MDKAVFDRSKAVEQTDSIKFVKPASKPITGGFSYNPNQNEGSNPVSKGFYPKEFSFGTIPERYPGENSGLNLSPSNAVFAYNSTQNPTFWCYTDLYKKYDDRLATFKIWPKSHPVKGYDIAAAGFVYSGHGDKVICPWCQVALIEWETTDKPK